MSLQEEIKKAIGAHGLWKSRLKSAIAAGKSDYVSGKVQVDNQCDFGRWLYALDARAKTGAHYEKVRTLHAQFHQEAANVLRLVESGQKAAAEKALADGSAFDKLTTNLTSTLMDWSKAA